MHKLIAPAVLIFLCGIGVGFSIFPHIMPHKIATTQPEPSAEITIVEPVEPPQETASIYIPKVPEQTPLTSNDQESYVLQLFSPTSSQVSEMQTESEQMKLMEQTMMISYLLSNCKRMSSAEYDATYTTLVKYLTNNGVANPTDVALRASERARASYQMVYRHVPCDDPSLHQMANSLAEWRRSVSGNVK